MLETMVAMFLVFIVAFATAGVILINRWADRLAIAREAVIAARKRHDAFIRSLDLPATSK